MGRIFAPCAGEGIRPWGEYLPHVLERVFVQGTNTCPMFWGGYSSMGRILAPCFGEGIRPPDGYLPHVLERVFVHGTNTCLTNRTRSQRIRILIRIRVHAGCAIFHFVVFISNWFFIRVCDFLGGRNPESSTPTAVTRFLQYFLVSDYKHSSPSLNSDQSYCYTHSLGQPSPQDGTIPFNSSTPRLVQATVYLWSHCVPCPGSL